MRPTGPHRRLALPNGARTIGTLLSHVSYAQWISLGRRSSHSSFGPCQSHLEAHLLLACTSFWPCCAKLYTTKLNLPIILIQPSNNRWSYLVGKWSISSSLGPSLSRQIKLAAGDMYVPAGGEAWAWALMPLGSMIHPLLYYWCVQLRTWWMQVDP